MHASKLACMSRQLNKERRKTRQNDKQGRTVHIILMYLVKDKYTNEFAAKLGKMNRLLCIQGSDLANRGWVRTPFLMTLGLW
jgi:hypothetical protein